MKGVEGRTGDEGRLIRDPQVADRIEGIGKDNSLKQVRYHDWQFRVRWGALDVLYCLGGLGIPAHTSLNNYMTL